MRPVEVAEVPDGTAEAASRCGALARSLQFAGALSAVLDLTIRYANERGQFGRPIGRFQAVQHLIAQLAGTAVASEAAAHASVLALAAGAPSAGALEPAPGSPTGYTARSASPRNTGYTNSPGGCGRGGRSTARGTLVGGGRRWSAVVGGGRPLGHRGGADELWPSMTPV